MQFTSHEVKLRWGQLTCTNCAPWPWGGRPFTTRRHRPAVRPPTRIAELETTAHERGLRRVGPGTIGVYHGHHADAVFVFLVSVLIIDSSYFNLLILGALQSYNCNERMIL